MWGARRGAAWSARRWRGVEHEAKPRTAPVAWRRDGDIAPYRNGTRQRGTRVVRERGTRR